MKRMYFARKIRQLKHLQKQLEAHQKGTALLSEKKWQQLYQKATRLLKKIHTALSGKELRRVGAALGIAVLIGNPMAQAQSFMPPQTDPFGLQQLQVEELLLSGMADYDNDGDLDIFMTSENASIVYQDPLYYVENIGSATAPEFGVPAIVPNTSFDSYVTLPADLDSDGDFDLIGVTYDANYERALQYLENTGTSQQAAFGSPVINPFGSAIPTDTDYQFPAIGDLDDDGDLDILMLGSDYSSYSVQTIYFENTGSATNPQFGIGQIGTFPVNAPQGVSINVPTLIDLDKDGDLDLLVGGSFYDEVTEEYEANLYYYENTGSVSVPSFAIPIKNPFGLSIGSGFTVAIPSTADLDGDGDMDVLVQAYDEDTEIPNVLYFENTGSSGFQKIELFDVEVFPNPSSDFVQIKSELPIESVQLFDIQGKLIMEQQGNEQMLSLRDLPNGHYALRCRFEGAKMGIQKLIKE